jgi:hypothetical protein
VRQCQNLASQNYTLTFVQHTAVLNTSQDIWGPLLFHACCKPSNSSFYSYLS